MKRFLLVVIFTSSIAAGFSQTTVFSDNFTTSTGASYTIVNGPIGSSTVWSMSRSGADWGARIDGNILDLTNDGSVAANANGWVYANTPTASFLSPYNSTLNLNTSLVTWTFNMRQIRPDPAGFAAGNYGVAFLLGNNTGTGYAVMLGQAGTTDPVRLTRFAGTIATLTDIITSNTPGLTDFGAEYLSIKVTYDPATDTWELFLRNDGTTAFADPTIGTLTSQGTAVDATHTGLSLTTMGAYWQGSTGANQTAFFDNVKVVVGVPPTITTGTVSSPPFVLANCGTTASGSVDFTTVGTFNAGNTFTAQLSDDIGSFASAVNIGSISSSGVNPLGTIPFTIPAGTAGGSGYLIRVVSSDPVATGSSSSSFTITQNGVGGCSSSHTDYYRSIQTGNWGSTSTWESSPNNSNWIAATLAPTFNANTIIVQTGHSVTIAADASADQLTIQTGATLNHTNGIAFTLNNGTGTDMTVNGTYVLNGTQPTGSGTVEIPALGIVRVDGNAAPTESDDFAHSNANVTFRTGSIYEWNTNLYTPSWSGQTYFTPTEAVVFRFSASPNFNLGGGSATIIYGVLEVNAPIVIQGASDKTIVNGLVGTANITRDVSFTGNINITGTNAILGGPGSLILTSPTNVLKVGPSTTVTMISAKTIDCDVWLQADSYIELGNFSLTVTGTITGGATNAYIRTNGTGALTLNTVDVAGKTFPIGHTAYNPLTIANGSNHNWTAKVTDGVTADPPYGTTGAVLLTWDITPSVNPPSAGAILTFQFDKVAQTGAQFNNPPYNSPDIVAVWNRRTGYWRLVGTSTPLMNVGGNIWTATISNVSTFSPYALSRVLLPLPLKLIDFKAVKTGNSSSRISWELAERTTREASFEIQKSTDGRNFSKLQQVPGDETALQYNITDNRLEKGTSWYRLKMTDEDGKISYSKVVAVINDSKGMLITSVAPNPVQQDAVITLSAAKPGAVNFEVYDLAGHKVKRWISAIGEGSNTVTVNLAELPAGVYQVLAFNTDTRAVFRFVKQ